MQRTYWHRGEMILEAFRGDSCGHGSMSATWQRACGRDGVTSLNANNDGGHSG